MRSICKCALSLIIALVIFSCTANAAEAAGFLKFDKSAVTATTGTNFQIQVIVDPGTDQIAGTDAIITYDPAVLEAVSVSPGTYFSSVNQSLTSGKVSIWGVIEPASPKTGVGTIATVTFRPLASGTVTLQYYCDAAASNSSKIVKADINATNIINCTQNQSSAITVSGGGGGTVATPTVSAPTPSSLPKSGSFDNMVPVAVGGVLFLMFGVLFRFIKA